MNIYVDNESWELEKKTATSSTTSCTSSHEEQKEEVVSDLERKKIESLDELEKENESLQHEPAKASEITEEWVQGKLLFEVARLEFENKTLKDLQDSTVRIIKMFCAQISWCRR